MKHMCRMIVNSLFWLLLVQNVHGYPRSIRIPDLNVSPPEEVNSLERDDVYARAINPKYPQNNIEATVKEVEDIIKSNPTLPRLTRGEILDLLENITAGDAAKLQVRDPKAIMVVMPYTPSNSDDKSMQDLYTKPPVTHIIGAEPFKVKEEANKTVKHSRRRPPVKFNTSDNDVTKKSTQVEEKSTTVSTRRPVRRRRPETTTETVTTSPSTYRPRYTTTTEKISTVATTYHPRGRRPMRRRTTTPTPITKHPNHRYPDEQPVLSSDGIRIVDSPQLALPQQINEDLRPEANIKQEVVWKPDIPTSASLVTTIKPVIEDVIPESLKSVMNDLNLNAAMNAKDEEKPKEPSLEDQERIKSMLASIGVIAETTTTTTALPNAENVADSLSPEMRELLMSFGLLPNPNEKAPDAASNDKYNPETAEVKPESYIGFKPLPEDGPSRNDMDALLASFGLGRNARKEKAINGKIPGKGYNFDMIPENLKRVISDLGLSQSQRQEKKIRTSSQKQHVFNPDTQYATEEELKKLAKLIGMIKQLEKMNGTANADDLKKIDLDSLKELVGSLNGDSPLVTLDQQQAAPDPTKFDLGLTKNEVKRQESSTATSTSTSTSTTTTTATAITTTVTTEEPRQPSISDLEASFGGQPEASTEPPVTTTEAKRTGFYYLVDWNTFLDIDDTKGKRVNLRFQPTIGDPKRFLSVSVP